MRATKKQGKTARGKQDLDMAPKAGILAFKYDFLAVAIFLVQLIIVLALSYPPGGSSYLYTVFVNGKNVPITSIKELENTITSNLPQQMHFELVDAQGNVMARTGAAIEEFGGTYLPENIKAELAEYLSMDVSAIISKKIDNDMNELLGSAWGSGDASSVFLFSLNKIVVNGAVCKEYTQKLLATYTASYEGSIANIALFSSEEKAEEMAQAIIQHLRAGDFSSAVQISTEGKIT